MNEQQQATTNEGNETDYSSSSASSSSTAPAAAALPSVPHKTLFVLIDGLADVTVQSLADPAHPFGRTPLQAAHTPTMDLLVSYGLSGLIDSVESGLSCGSDVAHYNLLGYEPLLYYRGRGALETMGSGLDMREGDVAFKANFAFMEVEGGGNTATSASSSSSSAASSALLPPRGIVSRRKADRAFPSWGLPLLAALNTIRLPSYPGIEIAVQHATEHRCGVRIRGEGVNDLITGTDPLVDGKALRTSNPKDPANAGSQRTSAIVNELSALIHSTLLAHPVTKDRMARGLPYANIVLLRGAGARSRGVPPFPRHQTGFKRGLMLAPTAIIHGIGQTIGMEMVHIQSEVPEATGDYHTNLLAKARHMIARMTATPSSSSSDAEPAIDFGFLHVKAVDDAGHDRDCLRKIYFLEQCDRMLALILDLLRDQAEGQGKAHDTLWQIVLTGDHSTPVRYGDHSVEPVPFLVTALQHLPSFSCEKINYSKNMMRVLQSPVSKALRELCTGSSFPPLVSTFDELAVSHGVLGRFPGRELLPLLQRFRDSLCGNEPTTTKEATTDAPAPLSQMQRARL